LQLSGADLSKLPRGRGVAAITFGGGSGVLSADQCDRAGLAVPALAAETGRALEGLVPPLASIRNPVDLTPQTYLDAQWMTHFPQVLDVIAADAGVGTVFLQFGPMATGDVEIAETVAAFRARSPKPALAAWPLAIESAREALRAQSMHVFPEYSRGVRVMGRLADYAEAIQASHQAPAPEYFNWAAWLPTPCSGEVVSEDRCHAILASAGISVAPGRLASSENDAVHIAAELGAPVVMKGISGNVTHRAAAGLLALDLNSDADVRKAWRLILGRAASLSVALDGVYVQKMAPRGVELLVSAFRDPNFGVMLSIGAGGVMTELIDDVTLVPAALSEGAAADALNRLRIVRRAGGVTSSQGSLPRWVARFAALAATAPWRRFVLEVNPIKWAADQVLAVDGLLIVAEP
jgi:acyl-CoA synthetase (NDP forming)